MREINFHRTARKPAITTGRCDAFLSVLSASLVLLSLACPAFSSASLQDPSGVSIGTWAFEEIAARHLEVGALIWRPAKSGHHQP